MHACFACTFKRKCLSSSAAKNAQEGVAKTESKGKHKVERNTYPQQKSSLQQPNRRDQEQQTQDKGSRNKKRGRKRVKGKVDNLEKEESNTKIIDKIDKDEKRER